MENPLLADQLIQRKPNVVEKLSRLVAPSEIVLTARYSVG